MSLLTTHISDACLLDAIVWLSLSVLHLSQMVPLWPVPPCRWSSPPIQWERWQLSPPKQSWGSWQLCPLCQVGLPIPSLLKSKTSPSLFHAPFQMDSHSPHAFFFPYTEPRIQLNISMWHGKAVDTLLASMSLRPSRTLSAILPTSLCWAVRQVGWDQFFRPYWIQSLNLTISLLFIYIFNDWNIFLGIPSRLTWTLIFHSTRYPHCP